MKAFVTPGMTTTRRSVDNTSSSFFDRYTNDVHITVEDQPVDAVGTTSYTNVSCTSNARTALPSLEDLCRLPARGLVFYLVGHVVVVDVRDLHRALHPLVLEAPQIRRPLDVGDLGFEVDIRAGVDIVGFVQG